MTWAVDFYAFLHFYPLGKNACSHFAFLFSTGENCVAAREIAFFVRLALRAVEEEPRYHFIDPRYRTQPKCGYSDICERRTAFIAQPAR